LEGIPIFRGSLDSVAGLPATGPLRGYHTLENIVMLEVTEKAGDMIKQSLKDKEGPSDVRIRLQSYGNSPPFLGMVWDEHKESDVTFTEQDLTFLIDKDLLKIASPIRLDYVETAMQKGFQITSHLPRIGSGRGKNA